jgi:hypothetical protein
MLTWTQNGSTVESFGCRGHYTIHRALGFSGCVLRGVGHDGLPMLALPPYGRHFDRVDSAKDYALKLERVRATEPLGGVG